MSVDISWIEPFNGSPLKISVSKMTDGTLMVLAGELDASTALHLRDKFVDVTEQLQGDLVLDIGLLTFIDSSGLALLITEHKRLQAQGHELLIFGPSPMARRVFEITGWTTIFRLSIGSSFDSRDRCYPSHDGTPPSPSRGLGLASRVPLGSRFGPVASSASEWNCEPPGDAWPSCLALGPFRTNGRLDDGDQVSSLSATP